MVEIIIFLLLDPNQMFFKGVQGQAVRKFLPDLF